MARVEEEEEEEEEEEGELEEEKKNQQEMEMKKTKRRRERRRSPCFYRIFSPGSSGARLKIPGEFVKHMEGREFGLVSLMGPSGNVWKVELIRRGGDIYLDRGWPGFVRDHFVECGDLLVFRYDGDLCFNVQVFDQTACEKEAAFASKCTHDSSRSDGGTMGLNRAREEAEGEEESVSLERISECGLKRSRGSCPSGLHSGCDDKYWEFGVDEVVATDKTCEEDSFLHGTKKFKSCDENLDLNTEASIWGRICKNDSESHDRGCMSIWSEREKRVAQSFISCFPYFVRIMKRFNISGSSTLNIPYQFSMAHLPTCKTEIVLRTIKGGSWTVNSVPSTRVHTSHTLCGGWIAFVRSNDIKMGDVCIFELVRKFEFRVFILRVGKEGQDNQITEAVTNGANVHCGSSCKDESFPKKSKTKSLKLINQVELCNIKCQAVASSNHKQRHSNAMRVSAGAVLCSMPRGGSEGQGVELESQAGGGLKMIATLDEASALKSLNSGFPSFVRIMRKFNISGSYTLVKERSVNNNCSSWVLRDSSYTYNTCKAVMFYMVRMNPKCQPSRIIGEGLQNKIPYQFATSYLPNCKTEVVLRNLRGKCWTVNSVPDSKGRSFHTFCGGWMAFVRDNGVKMGDTCSFELVGKWEMRVHISGDGQNAVDLPCGNN